MGILGVFAFRETRDVAAPWGAITSYAETDTPVQSFSEVYPTKVKKLLVKRIRYRINFANAVTYTVRLYWDAVAGDYLSRSVKFFESAALQADDILYDHAQLDYPVELSEEDLMYLALEWSAAPGDSEGFITVEGILYG